MTESRAVVAWEGRAAKGHKGTREMMEIFGIGPVAAALPVRTTANPLGSCTLHGCSLLCFNYPSVGEGGK